MGYKDDVVLEKMITQQATDVDLLAAEIHCRKIIQEILKDGSLTEKKIDEIHDYYISRFKCMLKQHPIAMHNALNPGPKIINR
jgi:hypothetical protein